MKQDIIEIENQERQISKATEFVKDYVKKSDFSEDCVCALAVVFDEMLSNVVHHGFADKKKHTIKVSVATKGKDFTGTIEDDGVAFNPLKHPKADIDLPLAERKIGGLGIHLVRNLVDAIKYERKGKKNVLTLEKTDD